MNFEGKKVIVTGANQSIGRQIALDFAKLGADVVISYHSDEAGAEKTVQDLRSLGKKAQAFCMNFLEMKQIAAFAEEAISYLGQIDILVNNAAMLSRETIFDLSPEKMQAVFQVNTVAPLYLTQLCAKHMKEKGIAGSIINISSISGNITSPRGVGYGASKSALNKWTKHVALDLAKYKIRVNAVAPGVIKAGMNENTAETNPELWQSNLASIPLQRPGTPNDIANMVVFLASKQSEWITGKIFEVDGGHAI